MYYQPVTEITATLLSLSESNGQLSSINGKWKADDDILHSLGRALVIWWHVGNKGIFSRFHIVPYTSYIKWFLLDSILYRTRMISNVICGKCLLYPILIAEIYTWENDIKLYVNPSDVQTIPYIRCNAFMSYWFKLKDLFHFVYSVWTIISYLLSYSLVCSSMCI